MFSFFFSLLLIPLVNSACNYAPCQQVQYYQQPAQVYQQPAAPQVIQYQTPAPQVQYYFPAGYANSYAVAPKTTLVATQNVVDKEANVLPTKSTTYDDFEKELENLKSTATIIKTEEDPFTNETNIDDLKASLAVLNATTTSTTTTTTTPKSDIQTVTYIRETLPLPMPYRPVPQYVIPRGGCPPVIQQPQPQIQTQYVRPMPYYPRGYVQPAATIVGSYVTAPPPVQTVTQQVYTRPLILTPPPINDCCGKCGAPCKYRSRKNVIALASKIFTAQFMPRREEDEEDEPKDPKCNSEKLKDIMTRYITRTVSLSKRLIQKNAESELGGLFSVFCSTDDFSYVARSDTFCQLQKNDILCYAFKHK